MPKPHSKTCEFCNASYVTRYRRSRTCSKSCGFKLSAQEFKAEHGISRATARRITFRKQGLCQCGKPPKAQGKLCQECLDCVNQQRERRKTLVYDAYGNCCACCGETRREFLTIDHVNGDGHEHRKICATPTKLHGWIIKEGFPRDRYQLLCYNCNCSRGACGYCPHERERELVA